MKSFQLYIKDCIVWHHSYITYIRFCICGGSMYMWHLLLSMYKWHCYYIIPVCTQVPTYLLQYLLLSSFYSSPKNHSLLCIHSSISKSFKKILYAHFSLGQYGKQVQGSKNAQYVSEKSIFLYLHTKVVLGVTQQKMHLIEFFERKWKSRHHIVCNVQSKRPC